MPFLSISATVLLFAGNAFSQHAAGITRVTEHVIGNSLASAGNSIADTRAAIANSASRFVPLVPCRVADTRNAAGPFGGPLLAANSKRTFAISASACGIPASVQAFSLNLTVAPNGPLGFLTAWPTGLAQPFVSTLNSTDGRIVANAAIVPSGSGGAIDIFVTNDSHLVIDVNGYFDAQNPAGLPFFSVTPCRIADTRNPAGPFGAPALAANVSRGFNIPSGPCNLPASAQAYSLNATVVPNEPLGFLALWPSGQSQPPTSTLNSLDGRVVANAAIASAGANGTVNAFATGSTNLVLDTTGYFGPTGTGTSLSFFPIAPCRVADTRLAVGPFGGPSLATGGIRAFAIPQSSCGVPNAAAYALNVTAVPRGPLRFLTIWPADQAQPLVSTLNSPQGVIVANAAVVPAAADGSIKVFTSDPSDVVLDINGYFAPQAPALGSSLSVLPLSQSVTQGGTATYQVKVTSQDGFAGQVLLALLNQPNNLSSVTFNPETLAVPANGTANSTLSLTTLAAGATGTFTMPVQATSAGFSTQSQDITLTVNPSAPQSVQVSIRQFQFMPTPVTVGAGGQVTWTNLDSGVSHQIVADAGQFASSVLSTGQTFSTMPATAGSYTYHCGIHSFMTGTVVVQ